VIINATVAGEVEDEDIESVPQSIIEIL